MIRRPPRSTQSRSSAASDVYKRQPAYSTICTPPNRPASSTKTPPNPPQNHPPGSTATEPPKHPKTQKPNFTHSSHFQNRPKPIHNLFTVPKLLISVAFYGVDTPKTVNLVNNPPTLFTFAKNTPFCLSYANLRRLHRDPGHSTKISRKPRLQVHHSGSLRRPVQGRKPLVSLRNNAIPARPARGR